MGAAARSVWRGLCLLLAVLLALTACRRNETLPSMTTESGESDTQETPQDYWLQDFQLVRSDSASENVIQAVTALNRMLGEYLGDPLPITTDLHAGSEAGCEILIGDTTRAASQERLTELGSGEYIIETVFTDAGLKLVVGGRDDGATLSALDELTRILEQNFAEGGDGKVSQIYIKGEAPSGLPSEQVAQLVILFDEDCGSLVSGAVRNLWRTVRSVGGSGVRLVPLTKEASIAEYPYALIIGSVGSEAAALTDALPQKTHAVIAEYTSDSYRAWMVGSNETEILRAIQAFHTHAVVNGVLTVPLRMELQVTSQVIRDPCIVAYDGLYYVYENAGSGYGVRVSSDLLTWSARTMVFDKTDVPGFPGTGSFWAPEVHIYNGAFYLFGTYLDGNTNLRGTAIFRSESPTGPFVPWSDGFVTPKDRHSIDGTLYIEDGIPYMVYVDEWPNYGDKLDHNPDTAKGRMAYVQLSDDLKAAVGEYHNDLFCASDPVWTDYGITDGPWMYRCADGTLLMLWSNRDASGNYCVGVATSSNGKLTGDWIQSEQPLFTADSSNVYCMTEGGHSMVFTDASGRLFLSIHTPNSGDDIAMTLVPLVESDGMLYIDTVKSN